MRERDLLYSLNHPNIINLLQNFKDDDDLYFVFEHQVNGTLDELMRACNQSLGEDLVKIYMA